MGLTAGLAASFLGALFTAFLLGTGGRDFIAMESAVLFGGPLVALYAIGQSFRHRTFMALIGGILGYVASGLVMGLTAFLAQWLSQLPGMGTDRMMAVILLVLLTPLLFASLFFFRKLRSIPLPETVDPAKDQPPND